jgi:hypothetical protein
MVNEFLKIYLPRSGAGIDTPYKRYRFWHARLGGVGCKSSRR